MTSDRAGSSTHHVTRGAAIQKENQRPDSRVPKPGRWCFADHKQNTNGHPRPGRSLFEGSRRYYRLPLHAWPFLIGILQPDSVLSAQQVPLHHTRLS